MQIGISLFFFMLQTISFRRYLIWEHTGITWACFQSTCLTFPAELHFIDICVLSRLSNYFDEWLCAAELTAKTTSWRPKDRDFNTINWYYLHNTRWSSISLKAPAKEKTALNCQDVDRNPLRASHNEASSFVLSLWVVWWVWFPSRSEKKMDDDVTVLWCCLISQRANIFKWNESFSPHCTCQ